MKEIELGAGVKSVMPPSPEASQLRRKVLGGVGLEGALIQCHLAVPVDRDEAGLGHVVHNYVSVTCLPMELLLLLHCLLEHGYLLILLGLGLLRRVDVAQDPKLPQHLTTAVLDSRHLHLTLHLSSQHTEDGCSVLDAAAVGSVLGVMSLSYLIALANGRGFECS